MQATRSSQNIDKKTFYGHLRIHVISFLRLRLGFKASTYASDFPGDEVRCVGNFPEATSICYSVSVQLSQVLCRNPRLSGGPLVYYISEN